MRTRLPFMDTLTKLQKIKGFYKNKELSANLFRIPPTEEKLRKGKAEGEEATKFHYSVAKEFRSVIEK